MLKLTNKFEKYLDDIVKLESKYLTGTLKSINNEEVIVALLDDIFAGYLCYSICLDEADIISVCVKEEYRRLGIARTMIEEMLKKVNSCFLDVKETNIQAIKLYNSLGFEEYFRRKKYYQDGSNAILLKWSR